MRFMSRRNRTVSQVLLPLAILVLLADVRAQEWVQFRGHNASGVSASTGFPIDAGGRRTVLWRTALISGHSSPVLTRDRIFLTGVEQNWVFANRLMVIALDRATGARVWERVVPRERRQELHDNNNAASPTPVTDGQNVYAFFGDFGLISFDRDGRERWRLPLGPFNNAWGMGSSPVLVDRTLIQLCDQDNGSFLIAVDKDTGKPVWRVERPGYSRGFSTPVVYRPKTGPPQIIVAGSFRLAAYSADRGYELWSAQSLSWQVKPTPIVSGDVVFAESWAAGNDTGQQKAVESFDEATKRMDANRDGRLSRAEVRDNELLSGWAQFDLDGNGTLDRRDWDLYRDRNTAQNGIVAYRLGGTGNVTRSHFLWRYDKALPNVPSPLFYQGVLYMLKEGGILTSLDPDTGKVLKQGRLTGALGDYFSSPVAADGKLFAVSQAGQLVVIRAGAQWDVISVTDMGEEAFATPAVGDGRLYVRTVEGLYCLQWQK
jgi:outer membrane protein assembly factor BamB